MSVSLKQIQCSLVLMLVLLVSSVASGGTVEERDELYQRGRNVLRGKGVAQDIPRGLAFIKQAAEEGHVDAQLYLAMSYYDGTYGTSDIVQAVYWLKKAADQGSADALEILELLTAEV